jgi:NAD(P)H-dependent flavin oxidoreductase YrpB (nitropropane dioxygenase family)
MRTVFTDLVGGQHPIVGFNRSPGVVAAVTNAGGLGVLGASGYTAPELDAQLTWIEEQVDGRPYGVDLLVPEKFATGDPGNLVESLLAATSSDTVRSPTRTGKPATRARSRWSRSSSASTGAASA